MKKKFISFLTYNYFAQKFLYYTFFFNLRDYLIKFNNYLFKNLNVNSYFINEFKIKKKYKNGWSIIFLTYDIKKNLTNKILKYRKIFKNKSFEIIIITNFNKSKTSLNRVKIINLNSDKITLGKKRNLAVKISNYKNLIMTLDYFKIKNLNIKKIEKEISKNDLLMPKIKTLDNKRYLDWMYLDYPKIGKSFCPYNIKDSRYMYFHGSYLILKRKFIEKNMFSNYLDHRQGEDVKWSIKVRKKIRFNLTNNLNLILERFSYQSEVLNDKNFIKNNKSQKIKHNA